MLKAWTTMVVGIITRGSPPRCTHLHIVTNKSTLVHPTKSTLDPPMKIIAVRRTVPEIYQLTLTITATAKSKSQGPEAAHQIVDIPMTVRFLTENVHRRTQEKEGSMSKAVGATGSHTGQENLTTGEMKIINKMI